MIRSRGGHRKLQKILFSATQLSPTLSGFPNAMKYTIKTLSAIIFAAFVLCWFVFKLMPSSGSKVGRNDVPLDVSCPLDELPTGATNVSYHFGGGRNPNTFYEFDINESDFINWIDALGRFDSRSDSNVVYRFDLDGNVTQMLQISDGMTYDWRDPNDGDRGEHIGYDRATERCYYQYHLF
ncbi:MAG: hypothetical protein ACI87E_003148 [Mariniblastus sp.]|jgi:hypothetical protein